jgi:hypothetical protein
MELKDYRGRVTRCGTCTNYDPEQPMACNRCFCRGYVAECLACAGKGAVEQPVAGGVSGMMTSTCHICAGKGIFGVNKPEDWDILHPAVEEPEPEAAPVEEVAAVA